MSEAAAAATVTPARRWPAPVAWFLNPYVQLAVGAILVTASELLLKKGAITAPPAGGLMRDLGIAAMASAWTWLGILTYVASFVSWIYVLRFVPLGIAFAIINVVHVLIPLGCWVFLGEPVSPKRWLGIALVLCGLVLLLQQVVTAEEKL
jgi:multidrug transporter EmrE-like cation transporter